MNKYGIFYGRFQPFHVAHEAVVHEIIADGLKPFVCIGSSNKEPSEKNPYTFLQRYDMIKLVFPDVPIIGVSDSHNWDWWFKILTGDVEYFVAWEENFKVLDKSQIVWYTNNKEVDRCSFTHNGKEYKDTFYTQLFNDNGYEAKQITYPHKLGYSISATDIRKDLEGNKHFLDARVYNYIRGLSSG